MQSVVGICMHNAQGYMFLLKNNQLVEVNGVDPITFPIYTGIFCGSSHNDDQIAMFNLQIFYEPKLKELSISGGERSRTDDPLLAKQVL